MTPPRTCPDCGLEEVRTVDPRTGALIRTNIEPISGRCVDCLARSTPAPLPAGAPRAADTFDPRAAAARNDE